MNRANQNTNGATEAWHLTLKKMLARSIGGLQARRLDALVPMLFGPMLAFFIYNMKRKQLGYVINYKVEDIVLSSLHLAEQELKHAKVFSRPDLNNFLGAVFLIFIPSIWSHFCQTV